MPYIDIEKRREYHREYHQRNRERANKYSREYYHAHSRGSIRIAENERRIRARTLALAALGDRCSKCGFNDPRALQIDHVNGNGHIELKTLGTRRINEKIGRGETEGYQLLCANCNWIKRVERVEQGGGRKTRA